MMHLHENRSPQKAAPINIALWFKPFFLKTESKSQELEGRV